MERMSTLSIMEQIPDEASAYGHLGTCAGRRAGVPALRQRRAVLLPDPGQRPTQDLHRADTARRLWKCGECRRKFSVLTGTVFHGTKIPVRTWILVIFEMASSKNGVAAREIERRYDLTPKSAWFMLHRIREAMKDDGADRASRGDGRRGRDVHRRRVQEHARAPRSSARTRAAQRPYNKTPVLSLVDTETGEVRSRVRPRRRPAQKLRKAIAEQVDMPNTVLHTDKARVLQRSWLGRSPPTTPSNHKAGEYVRRTASSTNQCENFFSQLKRSHRRHPPPRQRRAPAPLPGRVRLPLHHPQDDRHRAHPRPVQQGRREAPDKS